MCGIVGYIGYREAYPILINGLHRLEYRGYDSAGVALVNKSNKLNVYKTRGKVADLEKVCEGKDLNATIGIAHTRWATHGDPTSVNAHPHVSQSGNLAIVHNGIIENYSEIKKNLIAKGVVFKSATDTEVLVQLIDYIQTKKNLDLLTSVQIALRQVIGAYAIVVIDRRHPDEMIAAKKASPLVIGIGKDNSEFFVGSDASPIIEYTDKMAYLNDGEIAVMDVGHDLKIVNIHNVHIDARIQTVDLDLGQIEKGNFPHFMLKEIYEQPDCLRNCMRGRIVNDNIVLSAVREHKEKLCNARRFIIVACGTSWHAGLIGKMLLETACRIPVEAEYASEFRYRQPIVKSTDVVIAISQSGETADTLAAIQLARQKGAFVFGICNAVGSSIPRATDTGTYIHVGPEIGVASTKAFTGQITVLAMLALCLGNMKGTLSEQDSEAVVNELKAIPQKMEKVLALNDRIAELSRTFTYARNFLYLGRGYNYPVALEGALKLKEISYIHAEGYPAAEMKHGPIALIDSDMPVVVIAPHDALYEKVLSNIQEIKARDGKVIALVSEGDELISKIADEVIALPETAECLEPLLTTIPLQLLAYHIAVCKGKNVDQPRNLAKSVTVE